eukprot:58359_1
MPKTRSKTKKEKKDKKPYIRMAFEAIVHTKHGGKGVSRQKIANYIKANYDNVAEGSHFNTALRRALYDGLARGVLVEGATRQRFKITTLGRKENKQTNSSTKFDAEDEKKKERKARRAAKKAAEKKKKAAATKKKKEAAAKKKKAAAAKKKKAAAAAKKKKAAKAKPKRSSKRKTRSSS